MNKFLTLGSLLLVIANAANASSACMQRNILELSIYGSSFRNNFKTSLNDEKDSDNQTKSNQIIDKLTDITNDYLEQVRKANESAVTTKYNTAMATFLDSTKLKEKADKTNTYSIYKNLKECNEKVTDVAHAKLVLATIINTDSFSNFYTYLNNGTAATAEESEMFKKFNVEDHFKTLKAKIEEKYPGADNVRFNTLTTLDQYKEIIKDNFYTPVLNEVKNVFVSTFKENLTTYFPEYSAVSSYYDSTALSNFLSAAADKMILNQNFDIKEEVNKYLPLSTAVNKVNASVTDVTSDDVSKQVNFDKYDDNKLNKTSFGFGAGIQYAYRCTPNIYWGAGINVEKDWLYDKKSDTDSIKDFVKISAAGVFLLKLGFSDDSGKFAFEVGPCLRVSQYELDLKPYIESKLATIFNTYKTKYGQTVSDSIKSSCLEAFACKPKKTCYQWGIFGNIRYMFNQRFGMFVGGEYSFNSKVTNKESPITVKNSCGRFNLGFIVKLN